MEEHKNDKAKPEDLANPKCSLCHGKGKHVISAPGKAAAMAICRCVKAKIGKRVVFHGGRK